MDRHAQKRLIRKLDLELFAASLQSQPNPQVQLEQYTTPEGIVANMLYLAAYTHDDILNKSVLDLGCGTGRLGLAAAFLGATEIVGVDIDSTAIKTAQTNTQKAGLSKCVQWINGDIAAIQGRFDTVLQNPPFGVQNRKADQAFLLKALETADKIYSVHKHPEIDEHLIKMLKSSGNFVQVLPSSFLEHFISKSGGTITAVYAMLMTIPKMFEFHRKLKHDFVIDLYVIEKRRN
ncbi:METTL5 family protein [Candidatus Bathycorpusculum sp.]|uniref:METTL5 family protein n=1 Tax=Candidatus Bathycorpusculum sp. TaxID=2994959 RepID=UPI00281DEA32|nr:METTL5 family protein [Candidatus Termitimicrobium sp.]MCL2432249.1 METTL5 family protein [Candidatus Termitimicrobium sp.]